MGCPCAMQQLCHKQVQHYCKLLRALRHKFKSCIRISSLKTKSSPWSSMVPGTKLMQDKIHQCHSAMTMGINKNQVFHPQHEHAKTFAILVPRKWCCYNIALTETNRYNHFKLNFIKNLHHQHHQEHKTEYLGRCEQAFVLSCGLGWSTWLLIPTHHHKISEEIHIYNEIFFIKAKGRFHNYSTLV